MLKTNIKLLFYIATTYIVISSNICHAGKNNKNDKSLKITGITKTKKIYLGDLEFEQALSTDAYLTTNPIAKLCIYSNNTYDNFNMTILANKKYISNNKFILYNRRYGKIQTELRIISTNSPQPIAIPPNKEILLTKHSDPTARGKKCVNPVSIYLAIPPQELRKIHTGDYALKLNIFVSNYYG